MDQDVAEDRRAGFFMVWTKRGRAPRRTHDTFDSAAAEAQRLARLAVGQKFFVLKAVASYRVPGEPPQDPANRTLTTPVSDPA